mgnify:FL=1|tara:strand:- start:264 stop:485 length:222 start_codon:yes stop_codon:yes gene_type:complete
MNDLIQQVKDIDDEIISLHNKVDECKIIKRDIIRKIWMTCKHNWVDNSEKYYGDISGKLCSKCNLYSNKNLYF